MDRNLKRLLRDAQAARDKARLETAEYEIGRYWEAIFETEVPEITFNRTAESMSGDALVFRVDVFEFAVIFADNETAVMIGLGGWDSYMTLPPIREIAAHRDTILCAIADALDKAYGEGWDQSTPEVDWDSALDDAIDSLDRDS